MIPSASLLANVVMARLRNLVIAWFGFSRAETNGFLILIPVLILIVFSPKAYVWWLLQNPEPETLSDVTLDSLLALAVPTGDTLFRFDPNTANAEELAHLGFDRRLTTRILNYRAKGGKFRTQRDLLRLYGIDSSFARKLEPYINLPSMIVQKTRKTRRDTLGRPAFRKEVFDINSIDSAQLVSLRGIGPKLTVRILKYRNKLGGFVSLNQLHEVYGLDSITIGALMDRTYIMPGFMPKTININTADARQLSSLPYIKYNLATAIAAYRFQHGPFSSIDELHKIPLADDSLIEKIKPYLTVRD